MTGTTVTGTNTLTTKKKPYAMEGWLARWYAKTTGKNTRQYNLWAMKAKERMTTGARVLEVAPGPGYLAIEIARLGDYEVIGLDISHSMTRGMRPSCLSLRNQCIHDHVDFQVWTSNSLHQGSDRGSHLQDGLHEIRGVGGSNRNGDIA